MHMPVVPVTSSIKAQQLSRIWKAAVQARSKERTKILFVLSFIHSEWTASIPGADPVLASPQQSLSQVAAIAPDALQQDGERVIAQPKVRAVVPRSYAPRPPRTAAAKPAKTRLSSYRPQRSVQSLFTHPLGHL